MSVDGREEEEAWGEGGRWVVGTRLQREGKAYVVAGSQSIHLNRVKAGESKHSLLSRYMGPRSGRSVGLGRVNAGRGDGGVDAESGHERINVLMPASKKRASGRHRHLFSLLIFGYVSADLQGSHKSRAHRMDAAGHASQLFGPHGVPAVFAPINDKGKAVQVRSTIRGR